MKSDITQKKSVLNFDAQKWEVDSPAARPLKSAASATPGPARQAFKPIAVNVPPPSASQGIVNATANTYGGMPVQQPDGKKTKSKKGVIITLVIIAVIIIGVCGYVFSNLCENCYSAFYVAYDDLGRAVCESCGQHEVECGHYTITDNECMDEDGNYLNVCDECYANICPTCNRYYFDGIDSNNSSIICGGCRKEYVAAYGE